MKTRTGLKFVLLCLVLAFTACTQPKVKKYQSILDPLLGKAKKAQVNSVLGNPNSCNQENGLERCEYRTSKGRNDPVPSVFQKNDALGPDLSPYEYFDVIQVHYDGFGIMKDWEPTVLAP